MNGAVSGHYFENYVIAELLRNYSYGKDNINLNFYRNNKKQEIDLIIEANGILHPVEIKKTASPDKGAIKNFSLLNDPQRQTGTGAVFCMSEDILPIDRNNIIIPANII